MTRQALITDFESWWANVSDVSATHLSSAERARYRDAKIIAHAAWKVALSLLCANWQLIETAVKDCEEILGWDGYSTAVMVWSAKIKSWVSVSVDCECIMRFNPTHWMSLPPPPAKESTK